MYDLFVFKVLEMRMLQVEFYSNSVLISLWWFRWWFLIQFMIDYDFEVVLQSSFPYLESFVRARFLHPSIGFSALVGFNTMIEYYCSCWYISEVCGHFLLIVLFENSWKRIIFIVICNGNGWKKGLWISTHFAYIGYLEKEVLEKFALVKYSFHILNSYSRTITNFHPNRVFQSIYFVFLCTVH